MTKAADANNSCGASPSIGRQWPTEMVCIGSGADVTTAISNGYDDTESAQKYKIRIGRSEVHECDMIIAELNWYILQSTSAI